MNHRNKSLSTVSCLRVLLITLVHWRHLGLKSSQWSVSEMNRNDDAILLYQCSLLSSTNLPTASLQNSLQRLQAKHLYRIHQIVQLQGPHVQDLLGSWPGGPIVRTPNRTIRSPDFSSDRKSDPKRMLVGDDFTVCFFLFLPSSSGMFLPCDPGETTLFGRFFFGSSKAVAHWTHTTHCGTSMKKTGAIFPVS